MTPLEYIATNPTYEDSKTKWLAFSTELKDTMLAKQATLNTSHRVNPIELTDGRWACRGAAVTEISGGVFTPLFQLLDLDLLNTATIIEDDEFQSLRPTEPELI